MAVATESAFAVRALVNDALPLTSMAEGTPDDLRRAVRHVWTEGALALVATNDGYLHQYHVHAAQWTLEQSVRVSAAHKPVDRMQVYPTLHLVAVLAGTSPP